MKAVPHQAASYPNALNPNAPSPNAPSPNAPYRVSVIIPTKNAERTLSQCLDALRRQSQPPLEILVVDNFSTDRTVEIAERYGVEVFERGSERSAQRNYGALRSQGDTLLFLDADMRLAPGGVAACARTLRDCDAVVLTETSFGEGFWARCKWLERRCYEGEATIEAARGFRREAWLRLGGYDEALFAFEDWDLHNRCVAAGYEVGRARGKDAFVAHDEGLLSLGNTARKKGYYGGALQRYASKHPRLARQQVGAGPRLALFLRHWRLLARYPQLAAGVIVMKTVEGLAGRGAGLTKFADTPGQRTLDPEGV